MKAMKTGLKVGDVMTQNPITVPPNITIRECARIMRNKHIGSVLVTENEELQGIITNVDIIEQVVAAAKDAEKIIAKDIMTKAIITSKPSHDVFEALELMKDNSVRHLPVLHKNELVGFLTTKDVLKVEPQLFELLLDTIHLREESRKVRTPIGADLTLEGFCELCGNYADALARDPERRLICEECGQ